MFMKLGSSYTISILVQSINGERITNDSPYSVIKDMKTNRYWNGLVWSEFESRIYMDHIMNGIYQTVFTPDAVGVYEISTKSETYQISKMETLEVYDTAFASHQWLMGTEFLIKYPTSSITSVPTAKIYKESAKLYWSGTDWTATPATVQLQRIEGGVATYSILLDTKDSYCISINEDGKETLLIVTATDVADNIAPIVVSHATMKSTDGTNCVIVTETQSPLSGVKISAYNSLKEIVAQTVSNQDGEWSIVLKPGQYTFSFEKDGYINITMQRTVI